MAEGRSYPCIRIVFLLNFRKSYMSVPVQVSVVPIQVGYLCFSVWVYRYRLELYRYRLATVDSGMGVPVQVRTVPVQVPLHLLPSIVALPETSLSGCHHPQ